MTTLTNETAIDEVIELAIQNDPYEKKGDISVTGLLRPPQMAYLESQHEDEIKEDVSEGLWKLLGSAVHVVLERGAKKVKTWRVEQRLMIRTHGWDISGKYDLWRPLEDGGELIDFKVTSAWSFLLEPTGVKPEWEAQLNLYAYMLRQSGTPVTKLTVLAILRDWMKSKAKHDRDYPQVGFKSVDVPLWSEEKQLDFLENKVTLHQAARIDSRFAPCTDEERWAKPDKFAAKKKNAKRAIKLFDDKFEAQQWVVEQTDARDFVLEHRPGTQTRCEDYCAAMPWCDQAKELGVGHE